ncbi:MAG: GatB/YqeY domain-containing protein [Candidatus Gottesmanbacteria bacterium]
MLLDTLKTDLVTAMKARNTVAVDTIRFLLSAIRNAAIAKYGAASDTALTDADVMDTIKKQVKTHKESVEAFKTAGRDELVTKEQGELDVLLTYVSAEMSDEELKALLAPVAVSGEQNFGLLMKQGMAAVAGKADGGRVSSTLKVLMAK